MILQCITCTDRGGKGTGILRQNESRGNEQGLQKAFKISRGPTELRGRIPSWRTEMAGKVNQSSPMAKGERLTYLICTFYPHSLWELVKGF